MRPVLPSFEMIIPKDLPEALEIMGREPGEWLPFSGGTDIMVLMNAGKLNHKKYISLWKLEELRGIEEQDGSIRLGALTTYSEILQSPLMRQYPMLMQAASETGAIATQNRGTIGGNIANASPAADSPPTLLVYDAAIELRSEKGVRIVPYHEFHIGYKETVIGPGEIVSHIHLPPRERGWVEHFRKVGTRRAQAISKVCFAGAVRMKGPRVEQARLALGSVAPTPIRCESTERFLEGQLLTDEVIFTAQERLGTEIAPIDDVRSTREYRMRVAGNLLEEFLRSV